MEFGVCTNLLLQSPQETGTSLAVTVAALGYDYIELPLAALMLLDDSAFSRAQEALRQAGIPCRACNNFFPKEMKVVGPAVDNAAVREYYTKALSRVSALGAQYAVFGSPWSKQIPEGFDQKQAYAQVAGLCREMGSAAQNAGVTVVLEHNNHNETNFLNRFHEIGALAEDVGHPNIRTLVDYYHIQAEEEPLDHLRQYGKHLRHVHFAKTEGRGYPAHMGEEKGYLPFIQMLKQLGYDGGVSIEAYTQDFARDGAAALAFLRKHFH